MSLDLCLRGVTLYWAEDSLDPSFLLRRWISSTAEILFWLIRPSSSGSSGKRGLFYLSFVTENSTKAVWCKQKYFSPINRGGLIFLGKMVFQNSNFRHHITCTLSLKRNATFFHGFFLRPRVRVMWPGVIRNLHIGFLSNYITPYKNVAILLRLSVLCIARLDPIVLGSVRSPHICLRVNLTQICQNFISDSTLRSQGKNINFFRDIVYAITNRINWDAKMSLNFSLV